MRNISDKSYKKHQNILYVQQQLSENRAFYEIMWKNVVDPKKSQTIWRMRTACWISNAIKILKI